jgi:Zn-dependent protease
MDLNQILPKIAVMGLPILTAITLHEVAHGWAARSCGDRTAEAQGRLSLNPINHVDPMGTIILPGLLLLAGAPFLFGWAKPVPVNPNRFKNYRADWVKVAAAGPLANFFMALLWGLLGVLTLHVARRTGGNVYAEWLLEMADFGVWYNILIAVFNLVPIPPLDGGRVLTNLLPARSGFTELLDKVEPWGLYIVLGLVATGFLDAIIGPPFHLIFNLFRGIFPFLTPN